MGSLSLLAASLVVAALGFGWFNALKEGVFDFLSFFRSDSTEEVMEDKMDERGSDDGAHRDDPDDAMKKNDDGEPISVDPEFDDELNALDDELDSLLEDSEGELDSLESEI